MKTFNYLIAAAGLAHAATIKIESGDTFFKPNSTSANVGDILEFHFLPHNHSVAQGDFDIPCQLAKQGGFYSGYWPASTGEASEVFRVTVNNTDPIWFYCTQNKHPHCKEGMVGVVNPPQDKTIKQYADSAATYNGLAGEPVNVYGGVLASAISSQSANPTTSATMPTETTAGAANVKGAVGGVAALLALAVFGMV